MSSPAHAHDEHGHGAHGGEHVPHVLPLRIYFAIFIMLLIFTILTVAVSRVDLGEANLFIAMAIATAKALMVSLVFMHLAFDKKFNAIIFSSALIFLGIFISFTMFDTNWRQLGGRTSGDRPAVVTEPFSGTLHEEMIKAQYEHKGEGSAEGHSTSGEPK